MMENQPHEIVVAVAGCWIGNASLLINGAGKQARGATRVGGRSDGGFACGKRIDPDHVLKSDKRFFCDDCRKHGVPQALVSKDYRAREKAQGERQKRARGTQARANMMVPNPSIPGPRLSGIRA